jgi:phage repressor protein C with HTH and peptisase S24 domain
MQVGNIALSERMPLWENSYMADPSSLTGESLYDRLMGIKPAGLAATKWAEESGVNRGFFTNLKSKGGSPRSENLRKLLAFIGKTEADLYRDTPEPNARTVQFEGAADIDLREDMPVFGTALGAERVIEGDAIEQTYLNSGQVIEYRRRPHMLKGVERVYGLYVQGLSMYPVFRDGAFLYVQKEAPLRVGDDVVVYLRPLDDTDDGEAASKVLVKRFVKRTAQFVELEQFNPALTFRIAMSEVLRVDRVLTPDDYA